MIYDDMELLMFPWQHSIEAVICVNKHLRTVSLQRKYAAEWKKGDNMYKKGFLYFPFNIFHSVQIYSTFAPPAFFNMNLGNRMITN